MKKIIQIFLVFFSIISLDTLAQIDTSFWFVAPEVWQGHDDRPIYLRFASFDTPAVITISQPANPAFPTQTVSLSANDAQSINLTTWIDIIENKPINQVLNYGIYISSTAEVTAYYEEGSTNNPDLFALKGENALGTEFYTPFQKLLNSNYSQSKAGIDIVATEDNTIIQVNPSTNLIGHLANVSFTINLNKGQTYSLRAASTLSYLRPSGTYISSDKKISVTISDDSVLGNPYYGNTAYDLMGDQLIPVNKMGQNYIGIKGELNGPDKIYITASEDNTEIYTGTTFLSTINAGESYELNVPSESIYFSTSKPVVALHMTGYGSEVCGAILPPIECTGSQNVSFIRSIDNPYFKLNILVKSGGENNFLFNGTAGIITASDFNDVPNTNGEWKFASITNPTFVTILGNSNITNSTDFFHIGIIMGRASSSRYGYFSNFNTFKHQITTSSESYCEGTSIQLNGEFIPGVDYQWQGPNGFNETGNNYILNDISLSDSGIYILDGLIGDCDVRSDTLILDVIALDDASFNVNNICQNATNSANITGLIGGTFSVVNPTDGVSINTINGELTNTSIGNDYQIMYQTNGLCPNSSVEVISVLPFEDASFTTNNFCFGETNITTILGNLGGTFSLSSNPNGASINSVSGELSNTSANNIYGIQYTTLGSDSSCSNFTEEWVEVFQVPENPDLITEYNYCLGENTNPITVNTSLAGSTVQWFENSTLTNLLSISNSYTINPTLGSTSVFVTELSSNNCQSNPTIISQNIYPLPVIDAGTDISVCYGEAITLNATGGINYNWNEGVQNNIAFLPPVGMNEYIVIGDNIYNCTNRDTVEVMIYPKPTPNAGLNSNVCGLEYQLEASNNGNVGYWTATNANLSSPNSEISNVINNNFGINTFIWTETTPFGCQSTSSVSINFLSEPNINILSDTIYSCENQSIFINGSSTNSVSQLWTTNGSGSILNNSLFSTQYTHSQADLKNKYVEFYLTTQLGECFASDTCVVIINKKPEVSIFTDEFLCSEDSSITLNIETNGNAPISYNVFLNDSFYNNSSNTTSGIDKLEISNLGFYKVTDFKDAFCDGEDSDEFNLILRDIPVADFSYYPRETSIDEPTVFVNDNSLFADSYVWNFGDSSEVSTQINSSHYYDSVGEFDIHLRVENEYGCVDSISKQVIIHPNFELFIPTAFTPDGDNLNDKFMCQGYGIDNFTMAIINRWGELVFKTDDINNSWDGKRAINGVYAYRIDVIDLLGKKHYFEGEITLLR